MDEFPLIATIAVGFTAAWVLGLITQWLRLSPIVGYLLAGVLIGPYTPGFTGDVVLTLTGLPAGASIKPTTVKADATKFTIPLTFAANQAAGEVRSLLLSGNAVVDAKQPNVRVKSADLSLLVTVPPEPPKETPKKK